MSVYNAAALHGNPLISYHPSNRATGQIIMVGTDEAVISENSVFFLEQIEVETNMTVQISDGEGNVIIPEIGNLSCEMSPIRCDGGIQLTGTVLMAKGFIVEDCITS